VNGHQRSAITLVEVVIAAAISTVLIAVLWQLFAGGVRQFSLTQRHLEAAQVAQLVLEFVENDLHASIIKDATQPTIFDDGTPRSTLSFFVSRNDLGRGGVYVGVPATYGIQRAEGKPFGYFTRNGRPQYQIPLRRLVFEPLVHEALDSLPERPRQNCFVRTTVTALDSSGTREFTLVGLLAVELVTRRRQGRYWNPIPLPAVRLEGAP